MSVENINHQKTWFTSIFLVYVLNDHSIILRKHDPGWRVVRLHVKEGYFFTPPKQFISPTWGSPSSCKQGLSVNVTLLQGWRNDRSTAPAIMRTWFESREEVMPEDGVC